MLSPPELQATPPTIEVATVCTIVAKPSVYFAKRVHVRAKLSIHRHFSLLHDQGCPTSRLQLGLSPSGEKDPAWKRIEAERYRPQAGYVRIVLKDIEVKVWATVKMRIEDQYPERPWVYVLEIDKFDEAVIPPFMPPKP